MSILALPNELLIQIAKDLTEPPDLNSFLQTNRRLFKLLIQTLYLYLSQDQPSTFSRHGANILGHRFWIVNFIYAISCKNEYMLRTILDKAHPISPIFIKSNVSIVLHQVSSKYDDETITRILERGVNIHLRVKLGLRKYPERPVLSWASWFGDKNAVRLLLAHGAEVNALDPIGETALHQAAEMGHDGVAQMLLENGADHTVSAGTGRKWRHHYVADRMPVMRSVLNLGEHRGVPLYKAAKAGSVGTVKLLFRLGGITVNINLYLSKYEVVERECPGIYKLILPTIPLDRAANISATPLSIAVDKVDEEMINNILEKGGDVHRRILYTMWGTITVLHLAAQRGEVKIMKLLLSYGADINAVDNLGKTVLHYAVVESHTEAIAMLLDKGADTGICGSEKPCLDCQRAYSLVPPTAPAGTPSPKSWTNSLFAAVKYGDEEIVRSIIEGGGDIHAKAGNSKCTALHMAVKRGEVNIIKALLDYRADINFANESLVTPLSLAVELSGEEVINLLLSRGGDIHAKIGPLKDTVLHTAVSRGELNIVKALLDYGADPNITNRVWVTPLSLAVESSTRIAIASLLLSRGGDVHAKVGCGDGTVLSIATRCRNISIVSTLLGYGANINTINARGETLLLIAIRNDDRRMINLLLKEGADVNLRIGCGSRSGETIFHKATRNMDLGIMKILLSYGADINAVDNVGHTALHWALSYRQGWVVKVLLEAGADECCLDFCKLCFDAISSAGGKNLTKLVFGAVRFQDVGMVKSILEGGVDIHARSRHYDQTILHLATIRGQYSMVRTLLDYGVDVNAVDYLGRTALHYAAARQDYELLAILMEGGAVIRSCGNQQHSCNSVDCLNIVENGIPEKEGSQIVK